MFTYVPLLLLKPLKALERHGPLLSLIPQSPSGPYRRAPRPGEKTPTTLSTFQTMSLPSRRLRQEFSEGDRRLTHLIPNIPSAPLVLLQMTLSGPLATTRPGLTTVVSNLLHTQNPKHT